MIQRNLEKRKGREKDEKWSIYEDGGVDPLWA